jgi:hypothetical protein
VADEEKDTQAEQDDAEGQRHKKALEEDDTEGQRHMKPHIDEDDTEGHIRRHVP